MILDYEETLMRQGLQLHQPTFDQVLRLRVIFFGLETAAVGSGLMPITESVSAPAKCRSCGEGSRGRSTLLRVLRQGATPAAGKTIFAMFGLPPQTQS